MKKIILASHGHFSTELKNSVEMIMGEQETILIISLLPDEGEDDFNEKWEALIQPEEDYTIFVDLLGGTPCNLISKWVMLNNKNYDIYSGMNLPMVIQAINNQYLGEMAGDLVTQTKESIVYVNDRLN